MELASAEAALLAGQSTGGLDWGGLIVADLARSVRLADAKLGIENLLSNMLRQIH